MTIPESERALATLRDGQAELDALLARLSDEEMTRPSTIGGGDWSAKDLVGHIAFWEELAVETVICWRSGQQPTVTSVFAAGREGVDAANARNQTVTASQTLAEVRRRALVAHLAVLHAIGALSPDEWNARPFYPTRRPDDVLGDIVGGVLGAPDRPFGHVFAHLADLRAFVESPGHR